MPGISENLMEIEHLSTDAITEYARNARKNADTVAAVKASIKEFGFQQPIVVDRENVVIVGHARLKAARELGLKTVPVTRADNLTPEQVRAYRLLDNKIAEKSHWDFGLLSIELSEIRDSGIDLGAFNCEFPNFALDAGETASNNPQDEWRGMPEFNDDQEKSYKSLTVHFESVQDLELFAKKIGARITEKTKSIWFPMREKNDFSQIEYRDV